MHVNSQLNIGQLYLWARCQSAQKQASGSLPFRPFRFRKSLPASFATMPDNAAELV
jgi:hypothetical protein